VPPNKFMDKTVQRLRTKLKSMLVEGVSFFHAQGLVVLVNGPSGSEIPKTIMDFATWSIFEPSCPPKLVNRSIRPLEDNLM